MMRIVWTSVMPPPVELKSKLELPSSEMARLTRLAPLRRAKSVKTAQQVSIYFDTNKVCTARKRHDVSRATYPGRRYIQRSKAPNNDCWTETSGKPNSRAEKRILIPCVTRAGALADKEAGAGSYTRYSRPRSSYDLSAHARRIRDRSDVGSRRDRHRRRPSRCARSRSSPRPATGLHFSGLAGTIARATSAELTIKSKASAL